MTSIDKAIDVVAAICEAPGPMRFAELVSHLGLPKSTVHRLLASLCDQGLIRFAAFDQRYYPGYRLLSFAQRTWEGLDVRAAAQGQMQRLLDEVQETVHLAVLDSQEIIYIDKRESPKTIRLYSAVGKRGPLYCTGVGKAILAHLAPDRRDRLIAEIDFVRHTGHTLADARALRQALAEIRARGCALDMEEHEEGVRCVAAPIFNFRGEAIASVSITSVASRMPVQRLQDLQPLVLTAARQISRELGFVEGQSSVTASP